MILPLLHFVKFLYCKKAKKCKSAKIKLQNGVDKALAQSYNAFRKGKGVFE